jgi:hypothetical protein
MTSIAVQGLAYGSARRVARQPVRATVRPTTPRLRITPRGRMVLAVLALTPVVAIAVALSSVPASASNGPAAIGGSGTSFSYVTVGAGESLWSVAERIAPTADPREVITDLQTLNGLDSSAVSAGQSLAVPSQYGS